MMFGGLAIIGIVAYLVWDRMQKEKEQEVSSKDRALDILRERYAKGDISKEEFDEKRRLLES